MKTLAVLIAAAALAVPAATSAATPTLTGTTGPSFTIKLKQGTKAVTTLKAGTYKLVVKDLSTIHDFHLTGPGLNKSTNVDTTGTVTWTVKLRKGTYRFVCDPHSTVMHGSFKVG